MVGFSRSLERWTAANLLTAEQAEAIRAFERDHQVGRSWALYGIVAIGVTAIAIGVVSVVAANWGAIPGGFKLAAYLALQVALGLFAFRFLGRPGAAREATLALFALFFFAGIGLTAQVFHITSNGYNGLLFWAVLALPAVLLARSRWLAYVWLADLMIAHAIWLGVRVDPIFHRDAELAALLLFLSLLTLYVYLGAGLFDRGPIQLPRHLAEAMRVLPGLVLLAGGSILGTVLWYVGGSEIVDEVGRSDWEVLRRLRWAPWVGAALVLPTFYFRRPRLPLRLSGALAAVLFALAALVSLPVFLATEPNRLAGTVLLILVWALAAAAAAIADRKRLFDLLTLAIAIRLLVIYFEVFGSLMATGLGLILSGVLILAVAWVWLRFRGRLAGWVRTA